MGWGGGGGGGGVGRGNPKNVPLFKDKEGIFNVAYSLVKSSGYFRHYVTLH